MPSIWEMLQNAATGTYNGMSQAGEELGRGVMDAATLPRDVYQGKVNVDPNTMGDADFGRVLNMAGNVAGGGVTTGTASAGGTNLGMFIGQNAKTFPHGDLVSQVMGEGLGRTPQQVYTATGEGAATGARSTTGITRGVDGRPRVEIADNVPVADFGRLRDNSMTPLGSILDHPELYKAYPELQSLNVKSSPDASYYSLKEGTGPSMEMGPHISIARSDRSQEKMQGTLLHEIQHWVQEREGFGQGYNPRGPDIVNSDVIQGMQSNLEQMRVQAMRDHGRYNELGPRGVDVAAMSKNIDNYNALAQHIENTKFEAYSRTAGEVEARATAQRGQMPLAERQKMHPLDYAAADTNPAYGRLSYPPEQQWVPGRTRPFR